MAESKQVVNVEPAVVYLLRDLPAETYTTAAKTYTTCFLKQEIEDITVQEIMENISYSS
jgi:hypothetical protein